MSLSKRESVIALIMAVALFAIVAFFVGVERVWAILEPLYTVPR